MTKTEDTRMQEAIKKFFHNDMLKDTNSESIEKWESKNINSFLEEYLSIQDFEIKETLFKWFKIYEKHIHIFWKYLKENQRNYRTNHKTKVATLTRLILAENGILLESGKWTENDGIYCSPSWKHKTINDQKVLFFSIQTNLSMISAGGALKRRQILNKLSNFDTNKCFLITTDKKISDNFLKTCKEKNIKLVTTKSIKSGSYSTNEEIITFEEWLNICKENNNYWKNYKYTKEEKYFLKEELQRMIHAFSNLPYLQNFYQKQLNNLNSDEYKPLKEIFNEE